MFKVGDRVKVVKIVGPSETDGITSMNNYVGKTGRITRLWSSSTPYYAIEVQFESGLRRCFCEEELEFLPPRVGVGDESP